MWQVIAPLVRWPLYSVWRLLGVVSVIAVLLVVAGNLSDGPRGDEPSDPPVSIATPTLTGPSPAASPTGAGEGTGPETANLDEDEEREGSPVDGAAEVAAAFVTAWARPDLDAETWRQGVRPIVTDALYAGLETTDPANIQPLTVTGAPIVFDDDENAPVLDVPTSGQYIRVHLTLVEGSWLVDEIEPL